MNTSNNLKKLNKKFKYVVTLLNNMHIEKREEKGKIKYFLSHSYREGTKVHKFRKYLGLNLNKEKLLDCNLCEACMEVCETEGIIVTHENGDFIFTVEPWGQLTAKEIINCASEILSKKLDDFENLIKKD